MLIFNWLSSAEHQWSSYITLVYEDTKNVQQSSEIVLEKTPKLYRSACYWWQTLKKRTWLPACLTKFRTSSLKEMHLTYVALRYTQDIQNLPSTLWFCHLLMACTPRVYANVGPQGTNNKCKPTESSSILTVYTTTIERDPAHEYQEARSAVINRPQ